MSTTDLSEARLAFPAPSPSKHSRASAPNCPRHDRECFGGEGWGEGAQAWHSRAGACPGSALPAPDSPIVPLRGRVIFTTAAALLCCILIQTSALADPQQPADDDAPFGDLLEGLTIPAAPQEPSTTAPDPPAPPVTNPPDAASSDPLTAARAAMQQAGDRLEQGQLDNAAGRAQQQAIEHLDRFLAALQSQQPGAAQSQPAQRNSDDEAAERRSSDAADQPGAPQPAEGPSAAGDRPGTAPADGEPPSGAPRMPGDLDQAVWGHLPERMRRQLQAAMPEEYLPAYRQAIGDYFQRLTELQDDGN